MSYILLLCAALFLSVLLVPLMKRLAVATNAIDTPSSPRKIHKKPIPLLGGLASYVSFVVVTAIYLVIADPNLSIIPLRFYMAVFLGGLVLMVGGFLDDRYKLSARYQIIFPVIASLIVVYSGIGVGITSITNPLGGKPINLDFALFGLHFPYIFIFTYLMGMIYTTKFLDGLDGLASGVSLIAGLTLFFLSLAPMNNQPITASLAIIFCGAVAGFLVYNFNPASIFLGEGGSEWLGFMLGIFSVILGGKIATAILVMGIPILDVAWAIIRRWRAGKSIVEADRKHLHFRLLDIGLTQKQAVLVLYAIAAAFGFLALLFQSFGKLVSLIALLFVMAALAAVTVAIYNRKYGGSEIEE